MASDEEYARMANELNERNKKWNEEEPQRIEKYNARIAEQNKTAEKKKRPRKFKPRPMVSVAEFKDQYGRDYRNMVSEVPHVPGRAGGSVPGIQGPRLRTRWLRLVPGLETISTTSTG